MLFIDVASKPTSRMLTMRLCWGWGRVKCRSRYRRHIDALRRDRAMFSGQIWISIAAWTHAEPGRDGDGASSSLGRRFTAYWGRNRRSRPFEDVRVSDNLRAVLDTRRSRCCAGDHEVCINLHRTAAPFCACSSAFSTECPLYEGARRLVFLVFETRRLHPGDCKNERKSRTLNKEREGLLGAR